MMTKLRQQNANLQTALCWLAEALGNQGLHNASKGAGVLNDRDLETILKRARGVD